jgi:hypothetical protein
LSEVSGNGDGETSRFERALRKTGNRLTSEKAFELDGLALAQTDSREKK